MTEEMDGSESIIEALTGSQILYLTYQHARIIDSKHACLRSTRQACQSGLTTDRFPV